MDGLLAVRRSYHERFFYLVAIAGFRAHAFVALIGAALVAGAMTAKPSWEVLQKDGKIKTVSGLAGVVEMTAKGLGDTARDIAISIAFASIIGMCLMESGAADKVVRRFLGFFGEKRAGWALLWATYVLSIPIFFDTMFMLMVPLARGARKKDRQRLCPFRNVRLLRWGNHSLDDHSAPRSDRYGG